MESNFSVIGKPTAMIDAAEKTTGGGKYTDDLTVPGMLIGKILHSPYPHARIKHIDTNRAEALDGVAAVVIGKDAPNPYGILPVGHDEHALALDKVRYVGDNVACVGPRPEAAAEQALALIDEGSGRPHPRQQAGKPGEGLSPHLRRSSRRLRRSSSNC